MKASMQNLMMINAAGSELGHAPGLTEVLDNVLKWAERLFDLKTCAVLLFDNASGKLSIAASRGYRPEVVAMFRAGPGEGVTGEAFASCAPVVVSDVKGHPAYVKGVTGANCEMAVPLMISGRSIGVLDAEAVRARPFGKGDVELFGLFGKHVAAAVHNAQLLEKARSDGLKLERRAQDLAVLNEIGMRIATFTDPDALIDEAMDLASRRLFFRTCALLMLDGDELVVRGAYGHDNGVYRGLRLTHGRGVTWRSLAEQRPILVDDVVADPDYVQGLHEGRCEMVAPILGPDGPIGVLDAESPKPRAFNRNSLKMFEAFAHQIAVALENARLHETNRRTFYETIRALAHTLEMRDSYTHGHSERVCRLSTRIGEALGLDKADMQVLEQASLLHDIGKIGVRDSILLKEGKLDAGERLAIEQHPVIGDDILHPVGFLHEALTNVRHHHEHWDGSGYPEGLAGEAIPLVARIVTVADAYDAMTSTRPYRKAIAGHKAIDEIRKLAGLQFDPKVVKAFLSVMDDRT
ncbi:MAG: GAF domain-containing protein [Deltaproteobacteria bacterium]|nr:GAF domain-containing protein [Deltaproteobacteria bacterium]